MHIYHSRWHELSDQHINNLFETYLNGIRNYPFSLLPELRKLERATLEVIEERTRSTVYRIRETGQTFQVPEVRDQPEVEHKYKPGVFIIGETENFRFIERIKPPRFIADYDPETKEITDVEWRDVEPNQTQAISTLKKAKLFLQKSVK